LRASIGKEPGGSAPSRPGLGRPEQPERVARPDLLDVALAETRCPQSRGDRGQAFDAQQGGGRSTEDVDGDQSDADKRDAQQTALRLKETVSTGERAGR